MSFLEIVKFWGLPAAVLAFSFWLIERKIDKQDKKIIQREQQRIQFDLMLVKQCDASITLAVATAKAVQRIPDAHCNGDMHAALDAAAKVKHEQENFLAKIGIASLHDE